MWATNSLSSESYPSGTPQSNRPITGVKNVGLRGGSDDCALDLLLEEEETEERSTQIGHWGLGSTVVDMGRTRLGKMMINISLT